MDERSRSWLALSLAAVALAGLSGCPSFDGFDDGRPGASTPFADGPVDGDAGAGAADDGSGLDAQTPCLKSPPHAFCDDFDGRDAGWSHINVTQGTAVPDTKEWVSPPRSLHTVIPAANMASFADWEKDFPLNWHKTQVDMDLWLASPNWDAGGPGANVGLLEVLFWDAIANNPVTGGIYLSAGGLAASAQNGDGGFVASQSTLLKDGWHHVTMVADPSPAGASTVMFVDGNRSQSVTYTTRAPTGASHIEVVVGPADWNAGRAPTPLYDFYIDNLTIDFPL